VFKPKVFAGNKGTKLGAFNASENSKKIYYSHYSSFLPKNNSNNNNNTNWNRNKLQG